MTPGPDFTGSTGARPPYDSSKEGFRGRAVADDSAVGVIKSSSVCDMLSLLFKSISIKPLI